jgi:hypothetical protein
LYQRHVSMQAARTARRASPPSASKQPAVREPRPQRTYPGESSDEGLAKRKRRWLRNRVAAKQGVGPRDVIVDADGKHVVHVKKPTVAATVEHVSHSPPPKAIAAVTAKKMSTGAKVGLGLAGLAAAAGVAHGLHRALTPKRYGHE